MVDAGVDRVVAISPSTTDGDKVEATYTKSSLDYLSVNIPVGSGDMEGWRGVPRSKCGGWKWHGRYSTIHESSLMSTRQFVLIPCTGRSISLVRPKKMTCRELLASPTWLRSLHCWPALQNLFKHVDSGWGGLDSPRFLFASHRHHRRGCISSSSLSLVRPFSVEQSKWCADFILH